jgi:small subunit ribosomal protein S17
MAERKKKTDRKMEEKIVETPKEKRVGTRGRVFEGTVIKKFPKRAVIQFERMNYVRKYERYAKSKTKIHARVPEVLEKEINVGDVIQVQECRPLSKIIHFIVIKKIRSAEEKEKEK